MATRRGGASERLDDMTSLMRWTKLDMGDLIAVSNRMGLHVNELNAVCHNTEMTPNELMAKCNQMGMTVRVMMTRSKQMGKSPLEFMALQTRKETGTGLKTTSTGMGGGPKTSEVTSTGNKNGSSEGTVEKSKWLSRITPSGIGTKVQKSQQPDDKKSNEQPQKRGKHPSRELLAALRKMILADAEPFRQERPDFCAELDRREQAGVDEKALVKLLLQQIGFEYNHSKNLQINVADLRTTVADLEKAKTELQVINYELLGDNSDLLERVDWRSSTQTRDEYEVKMENQKRAVKNAMHELRETKKELLKEVLDLKKAGKTVPAGSDVGERFGMDFSTFQDERRGGITEEDVEARINEMQVECQGRLDEMQRQHNDQLVNLRLEMKAKVQEEHEFEMSDLRSQYALNMDGLKGDLKRVEKIHRDTVAKAKREYEDQVNRLNTQIFTMKGGIDKAESDHNWSLQQMEQGHKAELIRVNHEHDVELQRRQDNYQSRVDKLEEGFAIALQQAEETLKLERGQWSQTKGDMEKRHRNELRDLKDEHREEVSRRGKEALAECARLNALMDEMERDQVAKLADKTAALDAEKAQLETRFAEKEASLKKKYQEMSTALEEKHAEEKAQLRRDRDAYSAALLERDRARDKVEYLQDVEIKDKFQGLKEDVENLARSEWMNDPGKEKTLKLLTPTPERLMRQVLQHSIWVVLHEHIFCSPFRVFGDEGMKYETDWIKECGGEDPAFNNGVYTWPTPEVDTERWRFVTVKECRSFLRKPASPLDPRAQLKRSFADKRDTIRNALREMLSEVVEVDKSHVQKLEKLAQKATNVWLEFSMQPFRLIIEVQGAKVESIESRIVQARMSSFDLVLVPRLKSFGNSKGQDLKAEATIGSYDGEIVRIGTSTSSKPPLSSQRGPLSRRPSVSR
ncbi:uncharacterized protein LY89DRAFT_783722 [Mollisia scopiformis]|uniref:Uncharacterized protein n=1 Tax=Mollisia scopiformis TaxID=149040 RepID=A0A194X477_MOLSC|nr:uncharacterized protein LY89DRAFT_783722 [Mollisia scopiformis]KUJ14622.1 hypothetical protein LY89DRAFT_783722 [Mollisia scopiformis]